VDRGVKQRIPADHRDAGHGASAIRRRKLHVEPELLRNTLSDTRDILRRPHDFLKQQDIRRAKLLHDRVNVGDLRQV
jgi:hypothetical protein